MASLTDVGLVGGFFKKCPTQVSKMCDWIKASDKMLSDLKRDTARLKRHLLTAKADLANLEEPLSLPS